MHKRLRLTLATTTLAAGLVGIASAASLAAATAAPNCPTVSAALVKATLGGSPVAPPAQTASSNSFDGYKASVVSCSYASTINISFSMPATAADYKLAHTTLSHATAETTVPGIGNAAFSGTGSNTIGAYNAKTKKTTNTTVKTVNLWVLVTGKTFFEISASGVTLAKEEALARKMVPLV